ncbi:MAG TPA: SDR family NAD(P)-dependent oxidoreductase [Patescibacteria group bacterium]|nr:SDR family NAD(P)-dependent oxidoreductase [Patescibacteria group bacterium]
MTSSATGTTGSAGPTGYQGLAIDLKGHTALVTGGSRGIGRACCNLLAKAGARVAVHYRVRAGEATDLVESIRGAGGIAEAFAADLSEEKQVAALVAGVVSTLGAPTLLVNNAGIWEGRAVDEMTLDAWERTFAINLRSMFLCARSVVPHMKRAGSGRIVNIASTAGQRGEAFHSDYAATKGAAIAFTRSLATELAPAGIRVNCVAPGWVDTEMCDEAFAGGGREAIEKTIPLRRVGRPDEIAGAVLFALSDLSSFMTGAVVSVNGGAVMA